MKVAFYKGTRNGLAGIYNRVVRLLDGSIYSHAELVFSDGMSASSSYMDKGVRFKKIDYDPAKWDIFDLPESFVEFSAVQWFENHVGQQYDLAGNIRVVVSWWPHSKTKWHCTEAIAAAIGLSEADTYGPRKLFERVVGQL